MATTIGQMILVAGPYRSEHRRRPRQDCPADRFLVLESRSAAPMIPLALFGSDFTGASLLTFCCITAHDDDMVNSLAGDRIRMKLDLVSVPVVSGRHQVLDSGRDGRDNCATYRDRAAGETGRERTANFFNMRCVILRASAPILSRFIENVRWNAARARHHGCKRTVTSSRVPASHAHSPDVLAIAVLGAVPMSRSIRRSIAGVDCRAGICPEVQPRTSWRQKGGDGDAVTTVGHSNLVYCRGENQAH